MSPGILVYKKGVEHQFRGNLIRPAPALAIKLQGAGHPRVLALGMFSKCFSDLEGATAPVRHVVFRTLTRVRLVLG